jgi:hypothetical protein
VTEALSRLHALSIRSLPCLLALLLHSAHTDTSFFSQTPKSSLLVIDDLSTPILGAYPPGFEDDTVRRKSGKKDHVNKDSVAMKRTNLLKELGSKLALLAAKRDIAVDPRGIFHLTKGLGFESTHDKGHLWKQCSPSAGTGGCMGFHMFVQGHAVPATTSAKFL